MRGRVYLVGAGPGDLGLITVKGQQCIQKADVIIYDQLANILLLNDKKEDCETIFVGKTAGNHTKSQEEIEELMIAYARKGKQVVRLKGGDPYVFGRGGEEGQRLHKHDIAFEVVPGVTSAIGGLAYAGIPITYRNMATSFHVFTGHLENGLGPSDYHSISQLKGTIVFLMGMKHIGEISAGLMNAGKADNTPAAIIYRASTSEQRVLETTLKEMEKDSVKHKFCAPSLIVIGDVVSLRGHLNFFEKQPLFGKKVMITSANINGSLLAQQINGQGGTAISLPVFEIEETAVMLLRQHIENLKQYTHLLFTSGTTVHMFFRELFKLGYDTRYLAHLKIIVIGKATYDKILTYGIIPDIMPKEYVGEALISILKEQLHQEHRILLPQSSLARDMLADALKKQCNVDVIKIYKPLPIEDHSHVKKTIDEVDIITFTSSSCVKNLMAYLGDNHQAYLHNKRLISIGPITSKTLETYQLFNYEEASVHTIKGIMDHLIN